MALPEGRTGLAMPKSWRDWAIALAVVAAVGGLLVAVYQTRVERGEADCRSKCAAAGESYQYTGPGRRSVESCTCLKTR
jgi:hypothetical protein